MKGVSNQTKREAAAEVDLDEPSTHKRHEETSNAVGTAPQPKVHIARLSPPEQNCDEEIMLCGTERDC
jgi:hypothetical protein